MFGAGRYGNKKPPVGSTLLRGHPLTQGLVFAGLFNEGGGPTARDMTGLVPGTLTGSGTTWDNDDDINFAGSSANYVNLGTPLPTFGGGPFTVVVRAFVASAAIPQYIVARGNAGITRLWELILNTDGTARFDVYDGTNNPQAHGATNRQGAVHTYGGVKSGASGAGSVILYVDGIQEASVANTAGTYDNAADSTTFGQRADDPTRFFKGKMYFAYVWNRALTAGEMQWIQVQPYDMFVRANRNRVFVVGGGVGPVTSKYGIASQVIVS